MAHDTSPHSFAARQADVRNGALIAGERDIDILHVIKDRRDAVDSDTQSPPLQLLLSSFSSKTVLPFIVLRLFRINML